MRSFRATSVYELRLIAGATHDAYFDADDVVHDEARHTVVPFAQEAGGWEEMPQMELVRRSWRYDEYRVLFMRGTLTIHDVVRIQADVDHWGDMGMLVDVRFDERAMRVELESASTLRATVSGLHVEARVTDEVVGHARRRIGRILRIGTTNSPR